MSSAQHTISVELLHILQEKGMRLTIKADVTMLQDRSTSARDDHRPKRATLSWTDFPLWAPSLGDSHGAKFKTATGGGKLLVSLSLKSRVPYPKQKRSINTGPRG
ncbi:hypothetical protein V8D89_000447 [Ganoderma adspersum]